MLKGPCQKYLEQLMWALFSSLCYCWHLTHFIAMMEVITYRVLKCYKCNKKCKLWTEAIIGTSHAAFLFLM